MRNTRLREGMISILVGFIMLIAVQVRTANYREHPFEETISNIPQPCTVFLQNPAGIIRVRGERRDNIILHVRRLSDHGDPRDIRVRYETDNVLKIVISMPESDRPVIQDMPYLAHVDLVLPLECELKVKSKVFVFLAKNLKRDLALEGINGNVELEAIEGNVDLEIKNGAISIQNSNGRFHLVNVGGDIGIYHQRGCGLIRTVNGNVRLNFAALSENCRIQVVTINGNVEITFPPVPLLFDLKTTLGMIRIDDAQILRKEKRWEKHLVAQSGNNSVSSVNRVDVRTINGFITIFSHHKPSN